MQLELGLVSDHLEAWVQAQERKGPGPKGLQTLLLKYTYVLFPPKLLLSSNAPSMHPPPELPRVTGSSEWQFSSGPLAAPAQESHLPAAPVLPPPGAEGSADEWPRSPRASDPPAPPRAGLEHGAEAARLA